MYLPSRKSSQLLLQSCCEWVKRKKEKKRERAHVDKAGRTEEKMVLFHGPGVDDTKVAPDIA